MQSDSIFSKEALDKLRSPEKLDTMLKITTPVTWLALIAILVLLFSVVLWSIFGAFTTKAQGVGLIMDSAGLQNISHVATGKIAKLFVKPGTVVKRGTLIAQLVQADQAADTSLAKYGVELASSDRDAFNRAYQLNSKEYQLAVAENVFSDFDGVISEVMVDEGSIVPAGNPICSVRITHNIDELSGLLYISLDNAKRVEPGMTIQIAPNGVDTSQSGSLLGVVRSISDYPISAQGISQHLGNQQLASFVLQQLNGAVMEVAFDLVKDADSPSGYLWTSVVGEHKPVSPGTFCSASIIVERKPPIQKVFYKFSQWLRSR